MEEIGFVLKMDEKCPEENELSLPSHNNEAEMEVTMTTQLESCKEIPDKSNTSSNMQIHPEDTGGGVHKADEKLSEENGHTLIKDEEETKEMEVTQINPVEGAVCMTEDCANDDSDDSDSDSSSSSSPSPPVFDEDDDDEGFSQPAPIKTRDEVLLEELPAVEEVCVSLPEDAELLPVGTVSSIIQQLVVIQSLKETPPLDEDSIIFRSDRLALGKVFEVFGPVLNPLYILRFNTADQIISKGLTEGLTLYYAPAIKEYTAYILTQQLKRLKGSDASWKNDQEPPAEALDYSDDEREQEAKRKAKNSKKKRDNNNTDTPAHITQNASLQQRDASVFQLRHTRPPFRHQNPMNRPPPFHHADAVPRLAQIRPMYMPPPCPYPPPPPPHHFPPSNYPLYPPPPFPPSFYNPSFSSPFWPPNSVPFSNLSPPPPPPPPQ